jgi:FKBP-type peptidyl-prolyl cis-trans isomerase
MIKIGFISIEKIGFHPIAFSLILVVFAMIIMPGCSDKPRKPVRSDQEMEHLREPMIRVNQLLVEKNNEVIRKYIARRNWDMEVTETGLWHGLLASGTGRKVSEGDRIKLRYRVSLLDGTQCYSSDSTGYLVFTAGTGQVEAGLDETVLLYHAGDSVRAILPPHLAFGLLGDEHKIPPRSIIQYEFRILSQ